MLPCAKWGYVIISTFQARCKHHGMTYKKNTWHREGPNETRVTFPSNLTHPSPLFHGLSGQSVEGMDYGLFSLWTELIFLTREGLRELKIPITAL